MSILTRVMWLLGFDVEAQEEPVEVYGEASDEEVPPAAPPSSKPPAPGPNFSDADPVFPYIFNTDEGDACVLPAKAPCIVCGYDIPLGHLPIAGLRHLVPFKNLRCVICGNLRIWKLEKERVKDAN